MNTHILMLLWMAVLVGIVLAFGWSLCSMSAAADRDLEQFEREMRRRESRGRL